METLPSNKGDDAGSKNITNDHNKGLIYIELAKLSQESFLNRRSYEWKIAFGLWIAIGFITYYAIEKAGVLQNWTLFALAALYGALALVWFFWWQIPIRRAFEQDKAIKHYYMHRAEGRESDWPKDIGYWEVARGKHIPWTYGQTAITIAFLVTSFVVILSASQNHDADATSKIELNASGSSVQVHAEAVKK